MLEKAQVKELASITKANPAAAGVCLKHLEVLGLRTIDAMAPRTAPSRFKEAMKARDERLKQERVAPHPSLSEEQTALPAESLVPTKYWMLSSLSVNLLMERVLSKLEPRTLSAANLRAGLKNLKTDKQSILVQIVEKLTGVPGSFSLRGRFREWETLTRYLCALNEANGRLGTNIGMPPDWKGSDGEYGMSSVGTTLTLQCSRTSAHVALAIDNFPAGAKLEDVTIEHNYSNQSAVLVPVAGVGFKPMVVLELFQQVPGYTDKRKKILPIADAAQQRVGKRGTSADGSQAEAGGAQLAATDLDMPVLGDAPALPRSGLAEEVGLGSDEDFFSSPSCKGQGDEDEKKSEDDDHKPPTKKAKTVDESKVAPPPPKAI